MKTLLNYLFKPKQWKKIGEADEVINFDHHLFAILEHVKSNGDRQYKKVLICKWPLFGEKPTLEPQPEDPLKEINEILMS
jgi:hypothetical protein